MLIRITISNYKSFKDKASLSFVKTLERSHSDHILLKETGGFKRLKSALLYGGNASGKSNFIQAFDYIKEFVIEGRKEGELLRVTPYRLDDSKDLPTSFDIEFIINNKAYSYGFDLYKNEVIEEWLYQIDKRKDDKLVFLRKKEKCSIGGINNEVAKELITIFKYTRKNELLLTKAIDMNNDYLRPIMDWFKEIQTITPYTCFLPPIYNVDGKELREYISELLQISDTGIERVEFEDVSTESKEYKRAKEFDEDINIPNDKAIPLPPFLMDGEYVFVEKKNDILNVKRLVTIHLNEDQEGIAFKLSDESDGTRRLLDIATPLFMASKNDSLLVFDELDRSLHPAITSFLYRSFIERTKHNNSQLILATHETSLFNTNVVRRDEIYLVNKQFGQSSIKPLAVYNERYDKELRKAYLDGRFTGIPNIGAEYA